jgi:protein-S-isoprenylcysteine O-methyltransferase Ste14
MRRDLATDFANAGFGYGLCRWNTNEQPRRPVHSTLDRRTCDMQSMETKIPPPIVAIAVAGIMKLYAYAAEVSLDTSPFLAEVSNRLCQLSAVIALLAFTSFALARTTINPLDPSRASALVTGGIFRFTRNPLYLSLLLLLIAYAIRLDSWVEWLGPALFVIYITRFQIIPEETILAVKFGDDFHAYRSRTRRWI